MQAEQTKIDPDEALWDRARDMLADELGIAARDVMDNGARMYVERHAPTYAAMLIAEDDELEAMYDEAHARLSVSMGPELPYPLDPMHYLIALAAPVVVHAAIEAAQDAVLQLRELGVDLHPAITKVMGEQS